MQFCAVYEFQVCVFLLWFIGYAHIPYLCAMLTVLKLKIMNFVAVGYGFIL